MKILVFHSSSGDQLDIYAIYEILKRRGRIEIERLSADLEVSRKIREVANSLDLEQRIIDRRTHKPGDHGLQEVENDSQEDPL